MFRGVYLREAITIKKDESLQLLPTALDPPPPFFCRDILQICDKLLNFADFAVLYTYMANIDKFARGIFAPSFDTTPNPAEPSKNSSDLVVDGFHIVI